MPIDLRSAALDALLSHDLPVGLAVLDVELRYRAVNATLARAQGPTVDQHLGRTVAQVLPGAAERLVPLLREVLDSGQARHVSGADDPPSDWDTHYLPIRDEPTGAVAGVLVRAANRSQERQAEDALRDSERALAHSKDRFRRAFEGATIGMGLIDADGRIVLANESMARMFGYEREALAGMAVHALVPQRQRAAHHGLVQSFMRQPALRYMAKRQELYALRRDGSEFAVEIGLNPMPDSEGQQVLATISDVTERRAAQLQNERALQEKTALLNEVHHRVKNNLQVISSLLNLQARNADTAVRDALRDSQSRVHSMALMHQLLYERSDFSALDMGPYLRRLLHLLRDTYLGSSAHIALAVVTDERPWRMDLQRAIPAGLVVTELVTNAIKHAFPDGRHGRVEVRLGGSHGGQGGDARPAPRPSAASAAEDRPWLEVVDDGVGLPDGRVPGQGRSLGFQLLPLLAEQCGARMTVAVGAGTRVRLEWPIDPEGDAHDG